MFGNCCWESSQDRDGFGTASMLQKQLHLLFCLVSRQMEHCQVTKTSAFRSSSSFSNLVLAIPGRASGLTGRRSIGNLNGYPPEPLVSADKIESLGYDRFAIQGGKSIRRYPTAIRRGVSKGSKFERSTQCYPTLSDAIRRAPPK